MGLDGGQQDPVQVAAAQHQRVAQPVAEVGQWQLQQYRPAGVPNSCGWGAPGRPLQRLTQLEDVQHRQPVGLQQEPGAFPVPGALPLARWPTHLTSTSVVGQPSPRVHPALADPAATAATIGLASRAAPGRDRLGLQR